jgi:hypothetical protein
MEHGVKHESANDTRQQPHVTRAAATMSGRRSFLTYFSSLGLGATLFPGVLWGKLQEQKSAKVTKEMLREAASVAGLDFTEQQLDGMLDGVNKNLPRGEASRKTQLDNSVARPCTSTPSSPA